MTLNWIWVRAWCGTKLVDWRRIYVNFLFSTIHYYIVIELKWIRLHTRISKWPWESFLSTHCTQLRDDSFYEHTAVLFIPRPWNLSPAWIERDLFRIPFHWDTYCGTSRGILNLGNPTPPLPIASPISNLFYWAFSFGWVNDQIGLSSLGHVSFVSSQDSPYLSFSLLR